MRRYGDKFASLKRLKTSIQLCCGLTSAMRSLVNCGCVYLSDETSRLFSDLRLNVYALDEDIDNSLATLNALFTDHATHFIHQVNHTLSTLPPAQTYFDFGDDTPTRFLTVSSKEIKDALTYYEDTMAHVQSSGYATLPLQVIQEDISTVYSYNSHLDCPKTLAQLVDYFSDLNRCIDANIKQLKKEISLNANAVYDDIRLEGISEGLTLIFAQVSVYFLLRHKDQSMLHWRQKQ